MLYNGEVFYINQRVIKDAYRYFESQELNNFDSLYLNDGLQIFQLLNKASAIYKDKGEADYAQLIDEISDVIRNVFESSDMSLVFVDELNKHVIIYRDLFGKRSLIL